VICKFVSPKICEIQICPILNAFKRIALILKGLQLVYNDGNFNHFASLLNA